MKKFLFLLAVLPLTAGAVDTDSLALAMARSNPDVAAAHTQIAATDYSGRAANVLAGPEAEFEWKRGGGESRWGVSVGQSFDWPGVSSARRHATEARTDAARQLYAAAVQEKWLEAKTAIMQYAAAGVQVAYLRRAVDNFKHLGEVYGARSSAARQPFSKCARRSFSSPPANRLLRVPKWNAARPIRLWLPYRPTRRHAPWRPVSTCLW